MTMSCLILIKMTQKGFEKQTVLSQYLRSKSFQEELVVSKVSKYSEDQMILLQAGYNRRKQRAEQAIEAIKQLIERLEEEREQRATMELSNQSKILVAVNVREESARQDITVSSNPIQRQNLSAIEQQSPIKTIEVAYYLLAQAYLHSNRPQEAVQHHQAASKQNPNFEPAYRQLATFYYQYKQYNKALRVYERWSKVSPNRGEIWSRLADIYALHNQSDLSTKLYMKALSVGSKQAIDRLSFSQAQQEIMILSHM